MNKQHFKTTLPENDDAMVFILKLLKAKLIKEKENSLSILKESFESPPMDDIFFVLSALNVFRKPNLTMEIDFCISNLYELKTGIHNKQKDYSSYSVLDASILFISVFIDKILDLMDQENMDKDIRSAMFNKAIQDYIKFIKKYTNVNLNSKENSDFNKFVEYYKDEMDFYLTKHKKEPSNSLKYPNNTLLYAYKIISFVVSDIFCNTIKENKITKKQRQDKISKCISDIDNIIKIYTNVNINDMMF